MGYYIITNINKKSNLSDFKPTQSIWSRFIYEIRSSKKLLLQLLPKSLHGEFPQTFEYMKGKFQTEGKLPQCF